MTLLKKTLFSLILLVILFNGCSETIGTTVESSQNSTLTSNEDENCALLWKLEGNGVQTSYIFGTIHLLSAADFNLSTATIEAVDLCDQLVLEIDFDNPQEQLSMMQASDMTDSSTLDKLLSKEDYDAVDQHFQKTLGTELKNFNSIAPIFTSMMLLQDILGETPASYEVELMKLASSSNMEILGLETAEEQSKVLHDMPYELQAEFLLESVTDSAEVANQFAEIVNSYKNCDHNELYNIINEENELWDASVLLDTRNKNWIPIIKEYATDKSTFIAFGAGHLGGENGVLSLLEKDGFTLTPIR